jgi:hypothetical protein
MSARKSSCAHTKRARKTRSSMQKTPTVPLLPVTFTPSHPIPGGCSQPPVLLKMVVMSQDKWVGMPAGGDLDCPGVPPLIDGMPLLQGAGMTQPPFPPGPPPELLGHLRAAARWFSTANANPTTS